MSKKFIYKRIIAGVLLMSAGVGIFSYLLISIQNRDAEASTLAADIQAQTIREAKLRSLRRTITGTDEIRQGLDKYIVSPDGAVSFIEKIESLGREADVSLQLANVRLEPYQGKEEGFEWLLLSVSATGEWQSAVNLLARLESLPYRTEVEDVFLSAGDAENSGIWTLRLMLKVVKSK